MRYLQLALLTCMESNRRLTATLMHHWLSLKTCLSVSKHGKAAELFQVCHIGRMQAARSGNTVLWATFSKKASLPPWLSIAGRGWKHK